MDNILKVVNSFGASYPFRDVIITIGGLGSFLFFQFLTPLNLISYIQILNLGRIEADLLILAFSFMFGRLLLVITQIIINFVFFLQKLFVKLFLMDGKFILRVRGHILNWRMFWKKYLREYLDFNSKYSPSITISDAKKEITILEFAEVMKELPFLADGEERQTYQSNFLEIIFATTFLAGIFISGYYFIFSFLILICLLNIYQSRKYRNMSINKGLVKRISEQKN